MATAYLYTINKRRNSTALPTLSSGRAVSLVLKDGTSLTDPTFIISGSEIPEENYVQFEGRFYHILEITSIRGGVWGLNCHVDVLATYKTEIMSSTAFVAYDTTPNTEISDGRLSLKTSNVFAQNTGSGWTYLGGGSCVIVNVIGAEGVGGDQNGVASYALTLENARTLLQRIKDFSENLYPDAQTPTDTLDALKQFVEISRDTGRQAVKYNNAASCIKSAIIFPCSYDRVYGWADTELWLGEYRVNVPCRRAQIGAYDKQTVAIPWQATDWRRNAPYTEILLYLPYVGVVNIPASAVMGCSALSIEYDFTYADGGCTVKVSRDSIDPLQPTSGIIYKASTALGGGYAIGESATSGFSTWAATMAGAFATVGAAVVSGGALAPIAAAGSAAIMGIGNSISQSPTSIGSSAGGLLESSPNVICMVNFHDTVVLPDSVSAFMGTPTMAVKSLSGLSGYVETRLFSVAGDMLENERIEINRFMDGGVYLE